MGQTVTWQQRNDQLWELIYEDALLGKAIFVLLCCACLFLLFYSLRKKLRHRWESSHYVLLCVLVFVWSLCSLLAFFPAIQGSTEFLNVLSLVCVILLPPFLCLHIQKQVSYKEWPIASVVALFLVPAFLFVVLCRDLFFPGTIDVLPSIGETQGYELLSCAYAVVVLIRSYLWCFNVFYQMPRRTRRSTLYMLIGISSLFLLFVLYALWDNGFAAVIPQSEALDIFLPLFAPIAFLILLYSLYEALHIMPAADVIVTSREFVVGSLSTIILVLNRNWRILDWNKNDWGSGVPLPRPKFMEFADNYRERILEQEGCRVSPHNENIIMATNGDEEILFLLQVREAVNAKKRFGYILEISEVTPIYEALRYFEEIAWIDALTGLRNRNAYLEHIKEIVVEETMPLLIYVGDANRLKHFNDTYGHLLGDQLLKAIAGAIQKAIPPGAFAARVGGDEFVVLIPKGSVEAVEAFVRDVSAACMAIDHEIFGSPSVSWGYAVMTSPAQSYNDVFLEADKMMYAYKKARQQFRSSGLLPDEEGVVFEETYRETVEEAEAACEEEDVREASAAGTAVLEEDFAREAVEENA